MRVFLQQGFQAVMSHHMMGLCVQHLQQASDGLGQACSSPACMPAGFVICCRCIEISSSFVQYALQTPFQLSVHNWHCARNNRSALP